MVKFWTVVPLEAEYLGTVMTWNGNTRSDLCSQTGSVEVLVQEWVAGKGKLSATLILAQALGMPALSYLALLLWVLLAQDGTGCSLCMPYCSHQGPRHACCLLLCSIQLSCSALQCSLGHIPWQNAWASWLSSSWIPSPGPVTTPQLGPASLSLPSDSPDSSLSTSTAFWPLTASVPMAVCSRGSRGMCLLFHLWLY